MSRLIAVCLIISFVLSFNPCYVSATDGIIGSECRENILEFPHPDGGVVYVKLPAEVGREITYDDVLGIIESANVSPGDCISYIYVGPDENEGWLDESLYVNPWSLYSYRTELTKIREYVIDDVFVTSVAKGMEESLGTEFTRTYAMQITGEVPFVKSQIGSSFTCTISASYRFAGPPEDSVYNSRQYRVRFYAEEKAWVQYELLNGVVRRKVAGNACVTLAYDLYSIDKIIT